MNFTSPAGPLCRHRRLGLRPRGDRRFRDNLAALAPRESIRCSRRSRRPMPSGTSCWMYLRPQAYTAEPPYDHILHSLVLPEPSRTAVRGGQRPADQQDERGLSPGAGEAQRGGARRAGARRGRPVHRLRPRAIPACVTKSRSCGSSAIATDGRPGAAGQRSPAAAGVGGSGRQWIGEARPACWTRPGHAPAPSRRLAVIVGPDPEWNLRFGYDVESWARQGWIDAVLPVPVYQGRPDRRGGVRPGCAARRRSCCPAWARSCRMCGLRRFASGRIVSTRKGPPGCRAGTVRGSWPVCGSTTPCSRPCGASIISRRSRSR